MRFNRRLGKLPHLLHFLPGILRSDPTKKTQFEELKKIGVRVESERSISRGFSWHPHSLAIIIPHTNQEGLPAVVAVSSWSIEGGLSNSPH
jgi:hypothetical protein